LQIPLPRHAEHRMHGKEKLRRSASDLKRLDRELASADPAPVCEDAALYRRFLMVVPAAEIVESLAGATEHLLIPGLGTLDAVIGDSHPRTDIVAVNEKECVLHPLHEHPPRLGDVKFDVGMVFEFFGQYPVDQMIEIVQGRLFSLFPDPAMVADHAETFHLPRIQRRDPCREFRDFVHGEHDLFHDMHVRLPFLPGENSRAFHDVAEEIDVEYRVRRIVEVDFKYLFEGDFQELQALKEDVDVVSAETTGFLLIHELTYLRVRPQEHHLLCLVLFVEKKFFSGRRFWWRERLHGAKDVFADDLKQGALLLQRREFRKVQPLAHLVRV